jgi:hypothetical protein
MPKKVDKENECYMPSVTLIKYMKDKLQVEQKRQKLLSRGEDLPAEDKQHIRNLDRMKVHILDSYIFPAMANLTFFLEYIAENPKELQEVFEDDLKELLLGKNKQKQEDKTQSEHKKPRFIDQTQSVFARLIDAALEWNEQEYPNNFRQKLIHILQNTIFQKINDLALKEYDDAFANNIVQIDMGRAWYWTRLYARNTEKEKEDPDRPVLF